MQKNINQFKSKNTVIKVISFADPKDLKEYQEHFQWKMEIFSDPKRNLYRAFDLKRGNWSEVFHPRTILKYVGYIAKGQKLKKTTQDIYQMGGDFIFGRNGKLLYTFQSARPDDRPTVEELLRHL